MIARSSVVRVTPQVNRQSRQAPGLMAAWPLNDGGGLVARDALGNNHGTLVNGPTWTQGRLGGALGLDGSNDYVNIGNIAQFNFAGNAPFSVFAWVLFNSYSGQIAVVSKGMADFPYTGWQIGINNDASPSVLGVWLTGSSYPLWIRSRSTFTPPIGTLIHIGFSYNGSGSASGLNIFANGLLLSKTTDINALGTSSMETNVNLEIGARDGIIPMNGKISDVRIYNRALSVTEVQQMYWRPRELYAPPRSLLYAAAIEEAYNIWIAGQRAQQVWCGGHRAQQMWASRQRIL